MFDPKLSMVFPPAALQGAILISATVWKAAWLAVLPQRLLSNKLPPKPPPRRSEPPAEPAPTESQAEPAEAALAVPPLALPTVQDGREAAIGWHIRSAVALKENHLWLHL
eukprot:Skav234100  [mRNA]  locus=scaffold183:29479:31362:- [translate_table: standard]